MAQIASHPVPPECEQRHAEQPEDAGGRSITGRCPIGESEGYDRPGV